jgi:hypothetical protein
MSIRVNPSHVPLLSHGLLHRKFPLKQSIKMPQTSFPRAHVGVHAPLLSAFSPAFSADACLIGDLASCCDSSCPSCPDQTPAAWPGGCGCGMALLWRGWPLAWQKGPAPASTWEEMSPWVLLLDETSYPAPSDECVNVQDGVLVGCRRMCADFPLAAADTLLHVPWQLYVIDCDIWRVTER